MEYKKVVLKLSLFFDGACYKSNKGRVPIGIGVHAMVNGQVEEAECFYNALPMWGTNNDAEWQALAKALQIAYLFCEKWHRCEISVRIFGDSRNVVDGFNGERAVGAKFALYEMDVRDYAERLGDKLKSVSWIPREQNTEADKLSKKGLPDAG